MIVVDLGCATQGGDESIGPLIERYDPDLLLGFDPWPGLVESSEMDDGTMVILKRMAAWTYNGRIPYVQDGLRSRTLGGDRRGMVRCFDLAKFLAALPQGDLVVKFDVEGAELALLEHLHVNMIDAKITAALIEWHDEKPYWPTGGDRRKERILNVLRCRVEPW